MANPFKMVGPWIGAGIPIFLGVITIILVSMGALAGNESLKGVYEYIIMPIGFLAYPYLKLLALTGDEAGIVAIPVAIIGSIVNGFLIGWGIQSLIQKYT